MGRFLAFMVSVQTVVLTLTLLTWGIWEAPNNACGWQMRFNSAFKGLKQSHIWHAVPLIHTRHAAPLPCSDSAVSFVKVRMVAGNIRTASPKV